MTGRLHPLITSRIIDGYEYRHGNGDGLPFPNILTVVASLDGYPAFRNGNLPVFYRKLE